MTQGKSAWDLKINILRIGEDIIGYILLAGRRALLIQFSVFFDNFGIEDGTVRPYISMVTAVDWLIFDGGQNNNKFQIP